MLQDAPQAKIIWTNIWSPHPLKIFADDSSSESEEEPPTMHKTQILHPDLSHSPKYIPMYDSKAHFCSKHLKSIIKKAFMS